MVFCTPRGSLSIPKLNGVRDKIDSVHTILRLEQGKALLAMDHPVFDEYRATLPTLDPPTLFFAQKSAEQIFVPAHKFGSYPATRNWMDMLGTQESVHLCCDSTGIDIFLLAGKINRVDLRAGADDLTKRPFHSNRSQNPAMNLLFAALYDLIFSTITRFGYLVPDGKGRTVDHIFEEKVYGSDVFLVSPATIAYLKWLIYLSPYSKKGDVPHNDYYDRQLSLFEHPANAGWRDALRTKLEEWYEMHPPASRKRSRSSCGARRSVSVDNEDFMFPSEIRDDCAGGGAAAVAAPPPAAGGNAAAGAGGDSSD